MIKYRTKLIEKLTHGRAVSHMLKTTGGMVKPPDVVTCFGSYKVHTRPLIDWNVDTPDGEWQTIKLYFTYSRNGGPIQRVMIDENIEDWDAIDLLYSKLDSDLCRAQDGESLAFYLLSDNMGLAEQVIPELNDIHLPPVLLPPIEVAQMTMARVPEQPDYDYTITGIGGDGLIPIPNVFNIDSRNISIPHPYGAIDPETVDWMAWPRWYPNNTIVKEDNTIVIYPSEGIEPHDFDLFSALGGVGNTPITINSCVKAVPRKYSCEASHVVGSQVRSLILARMALAESGVQSTAYREPIRFSDTPFPFKAAGWSGDPLSWPPYMPGESGTWGHDWVATYRRNDGPLKSITWNTGSLNPGSHHSVWDAIKELLLDDYGRTAFMLSDFNSTASSYNDDGDVTVKSGIRSNLNFTTKPPEEGEPLHRYIQPYRFSGKSVEVRDRQIQFSDVNAGAVWNENTITIYPTPWEVINDYGFDGQLDYYEYLCQYYDQLEAGEPITIHSCAAVEPADHIQVNTSITLNSPEEEEVPRMMGQGLSAAIRLNDGAVKYFKFEPHEVNVALNEILTYLYFMGKTPKVTMNQGDGTVLKINDLYFRSNFTAQSSEISGCSGTERDQEFWMPVGNPMDYEDPNSTPRVSILETPEPYKRESNKATFIKHPVNGYTDLFDLIKYTSGDEHTIYSSAVVPSVIWDRIDDGEEPVDPEPNDGDLSGIEPFTFTNVSEPGTTGITKFDIGMSNTDGYWEIRESGQLIASPNHRANGVGFDSNRDDYKSIVIYDMNGVTRDFEVYVRASTVSVRIESLYTKPGDVELEVTSFGNVSPKMIFRVGNGIVYLPETFPPHITDCEGMFNNGHNIGSDITGWDMSNVTNMAFMFADCRAFNQDISGWDVSNVTQMHSMFWAAYKFNQDLSTWCVSNILSYPNGFASEANAWTLPKPVWGTCPKQYPLPSDEDGIFKFTVTGASQRDTMSLSLTNPVGEWRLMRGDTLVRDSNSYGSVVNFTNGDNEVCDYTFIGAGTSISLGTIASNDDVTLVEITKLPTAVQGFSFPMRNANLVVPDVLPSNITSLKYAFNENYKFNQDLSTWDTSNVTDMTYTFAFAKAFNGPIGNWNTKSVTTMNSMFFGATAFNQPIGEWDVSNVTHMGGMFNQASAFNKPIGLWLVGKVTDMSSMFSEAKAFNQDISDWDISNVTQLLNMFYTASEFNQDIGGWDTSKVTLIGGMFLGASSFNQDLSRWCVTNVKEEPYDFKLSADAWTLPKPVWGTCPAPVREPEGDTFEFTVMSEDTTAGAKPLVMNLGMGDDTWQLTVDGTVIASPTSTSEGITVENLYGDRVITISNLRARTVNYVLTLKSSMLQLGDKNYTIAANNRTINITKFSDTVDLYKFNLDNTGLTVPNSIPTTLTTLGEMFAHCKTFNDPAVTYWNTENITNMAGTFDRCNAFNQPLNWSTHQVTTMKAMFRNCHVFDQDINNWNVGQVTDMESMFMGCQVFNQPLNDWNVSSVTKMTELFRDCKQFNKYIANWDVSKVNSFEFCFAGATAFNEDISIWNVKSARWMDYMFSGATSFNQNLSGWCVTGVDSKPPKFDDGALAWRKQRPIWGTCPLEKSPEPLDPTVFNAEVILNKYDYQYKTKIVLDISDDSSDWEVYYNDDLVASPTVGGPDWTFVQKVGNKVTIDPNFSSGLLTVRGTMKNLKLTVEAFPQIDPAVKISHFSNTISSYAINTGFAPLSVPTTLPGVVNSMAMMFNGTNNIVSDITGWDTASVTDMQYLFSGCGAFNQDIGSWNVSAVTNMEAMFYEAWKFNGNIGQWDTGNVTNMAYMFYNSHAFNQDLSGWNVSLIPTKPDSFGDQWLPDWTLPKPNWGSDGKSPEVDFTDAFEFNVTSPLNGGFELSMSDVVGSYSIYVDNVLHSTGSETYPGKMFSDIPQGSVNYKIIANCVALKLMTTSGYTLTDLTVTSFGNNIDIARFSLGNIKLTVPTTLPSHMTNLSGMFSGSYKFNQDLSGWDVSRVTNMSSMFYQAKTFNGNISNWDMGNVTDMTLMLKGCELFNQDISGWNVSKCTKMTELFYSAEIFNQDISGWQVGSVSNMDRMFYAAKKFNQDLSGWNVSLISVEPSSFAPYTPVWTLPKPTWGTDGSKATLPDYTPMEFNVTTTDDDYYSDGLNFEVYGLESDYFILVDDVTRVDAKTTHSSVSITNHGKYSTIKVEDIGANKVVNYKFYTKGTSFNIVSINPGTIAHVDMVSFSDHIAKYTLYMNDTPFKVPTVLPKHITSLDNMFSGNVFNQDLSGWDTSHVTSMVETFNRCSAFNGPLDAWNVSSVTTMKGMFNECKVFNQPLNSWDVSSVLNMNEMFMSASAFDQPLNNWKVDKVTTMQAMFKYAYVFNQDISMWNMSGVTDISEMLYQAMKFNQPLNAWDVSDVTNMSGLFSITLVFNQPLNTWVTSKVSDMSMMFSEAIAFNQDLSSWDVNLISELPYQFDYKADEWILSKPIWGTTGTPNV